MTRGALSLLRLWLLVFGCRAEEAFTSRRPTFFEDWSPCHDAGHSTIALTACEEQIVDLSMSFPQYLIVQWANLKRPKFSYLSISNLI